MKTGPHVEMGNCIPISDSTIRFLSAAMGAADAVDSDAVDSGPRSEGVEAILVRLFGDDWNEVPLGRYPDMFRAISGRLAGALREYKRQRPCLFCGEGDPDRLTFHHRKRAEKSAAIAELLHRANAGDLIDEVKKCDVLCETCHDRVERYINWALAETVIGETPG